jgi:hypothetical protein
MVLCVLRLAAAVVLRGRPRCDEQQKRRLVGRAQTEVVRFQRIATP